MTLLRQHVTDLRDAWHAQPLKTVDPMPFTDDQWVVLADYREHAARQSEGHWPKPSDAFFDLMPLKTLRVTNETHERLRDLPDASQLTHPRAPSAPEIQPSQELDDLVDDVRGDFRNARRILFGRGSREQAFIRPGLFQGRVSDELHMDLTYEDYVPLLLGRCFGLPFDAIPGSVARNPSKELTEFWNRRVFHDDVGLTTLRQMGALQPCELGIIYTMIGTVRDRDLDLTDGTAHISGNVPRDPVTKKLKPTFSAFIGG